MIYTKIFVLEHGELFTIRDSNGVTVTFSSRADFERCTGLDMSGKIYVGYEPDIEFFQDSEDESLSYADAPYEPYENLIRNVALLQERKEDKCYGLEPEEALAQRKVEKREEIRSAFEVASIADVTVGDTTFYGGKDSAHDLKGEYDDLMLDEAEEMTFIIVGSDLASYPMAESLNIIRNIKAAYREALFKKHERYKAIDAAATIEEVQSISWE